MSHDPTSIIPLAERIAAITSSAAADEFSGVMRVDLGADVVVESAHGFADRAHGIDNTVDTRFAAASGAKGFTALVTLFLVDRGVLSLDTTARALLGTDLPLIDPGVTVGQLLCHRSGIGDYFGDEASEHITDYALEVGVHEMTCPEAYLRVLDGHPMVSEPGTCFRYNDSGFVILALLAERASGTSYYDLVDSLVCQPAGLTETSFTRTDELAGDTAIGYLSADGLRTNVMHVPVRGGGDGGIFTTARDMSRFWRALLDGRIVEPATVELMCTPHATTPSGNVYGLGCWLDPATVTISLEGYDAGVSFRSCHQPLRELTWTILSNTSEGAWPVANGLADALAGELADLGHVRS